MVLKTHSIGLQLRRYVFLTGLALVIILVWFLLNPPHFWLNLTKRVEPTAQTGRQLVDKYDCRSCHRICGEGAIKAPSLAGITQRVEDPTLVSLRLWLQKPNAVNRNTAMPNFHLSDSEIEAILAYLRHLDNRNLNN